MKSSSNKPQILDSYSNPGNQEIKMTCRLNETNTEGNRQNSSAAKSCCCHHGAE